MTPAECLNCGAKVPIRARACPECGACEETGWSESSQYESSYFAEGEFDYSDFIEREFNRGGTPKVKKINLIFKAISILLILFLLIWLW